MVDKRANIDLLFRNGLKDMEVLPPVEVWNNIVPVIRKNQRPYILLRSAATLAVLLALSFLTYRYTRDLTIPAGDQQLAVSDNSFQPQAISATPAIRVASVKNTGSLKAVQSIVPEERPLTIDSEENLADISSITYKENDIAGLSLSKILRTPSAEKIQYINLKNNGRESEKADIGNFDFTPVKDNIRRWSMTAMASPVYYVRPELGNSRISDQINLSEQSKISYTGGVGFSYKITGKLSIQSGLYYSSVGNEVNGISSFAGFSRYVTSKGDHNFEVLTSSGRIFTENQDVYLRDNTGDRVLTAYNNDVFDPAKSKLSHISNSLFQNLSYLELPVVLKYKVIDKAIDFNVVGGLSYNILVNNSVHTFVDGSKYTIGKTAGVNQFMVSSSIGMGMEYSLSQKISLNLEPTFRYYLNPFGEIAGMKIHPYSFGILSGISYRF